MASNGTITDLIKRIYHPKYQSVWTNTKGKNQSGKTDFNLLQFEILHSLGKKYAYAFGSNMDTIECDWIEVIKDFKTLKARCRMLNPRANTQGIKRYFFLISELADFVPRDQPWKKDNIEFIKELQKVRKYGLSVISDSIDRVDARVLNPNHFHGYFMKYNKSDPTVAKYYDWITERVYPISNIPKTTIPFDTFESASFYMEPQTETTEIPLNQDHLIVKKYLDAGCSIKKTGLHSQEVKRARDNVLKYYWSHYLKPIPEEPKTIDKEEPSSSD